MEWRKFCRRPSGRSGGRDHLILSQGAWSCQRSARWQDWLLIRTYHTGLKEFPEYMLFNVKDDPHETENLAGKRPDLVGEGLRLIDQWLAERMRDGLRGDPFWGIVAEGGPCTLMSDDRIGPIISCGCGKPVAGTTRIIL